MTEKDAKRAVQTSFYSLLDGNITLDGTPVPVGDKIDVPETYPQIVLSDWTEVDDSDKSSFGTELTFTVHYYDRFGLNDRNRSRGDLYSMVGQSKQQVRTRPQSVDLSPDFNLVWLKIDQLLSLPKELTDTHETFGQQIRYRMAIEQL